MVKLHFYWVKSMMTQHITVLIIAKVSIGTYFLTEKSVKVLNGIYNLQGHIWSPEQMFSLRNK